MYLLNQRHRIQLANPDVLHLQDKNKAADAQKKFQRIAKAYEVGQFFSGLRIPLLCVSRLSLHPCRAVRRLRLRIEHHSASGSRLRGRKYTSQEHFCLHVHRF